MEILTKLFLIAVGWFFIIGITGSVIHYRELYLKNKPAMLAKMENLKKRYWPFKYIFTPVFAWTFVLIATILLLRNI